MKFKKDEYLNKWQRIFKVLPVKTEDGFTVFMGYVYEMKTDDIFNPVRYHTNPMKKLVEDIDDFLDKKMDDEAAELIKSYKELNNRIKTGVLTEGRMRRGNGPPPVDRYMRPRPPPPPPRPQFPIDENDTVAGRIIRRKRVNKIGTGSRGPF